MKIFISIWPPCDAYVEILFIYPKMRLASSEFIKTNAQLILAVINHLTIFTIKWQQKIKKKEYNFYIKLELFFWNRRVLCVLIWYKLSVGKKQVTALRNEHEEKVVIIGRDNREAERSIRRSFIAVSFFRKMDIPFLHIRNYLYNVSSECNCVSI